jgi:hypothetical protein
VTRARRPWWRRPRVFADSILMAVILLVFAMTAYVICAAIIDYIFARP